MAYIPRPARLSTPSETDPDLCGNCSQPLIKSGGTQTHTDRSVLCDPTTDTED